MKIKKSLITILLILSTMILVFNMNVSNAADNAKIALTADKTETVAGDTIKITVKVKDITGIANGIVGVQGNLEYDNTIFESVTFASLNDWDEPLYNEVNGSFLTAKGAYVKNDEDICTISLKLKSDAKIGDTKVKLKDMQVADLDKEYTATGAEITVKVVTKSTTGGDENTGDKDNGDKNTGDNGNQNDGNQNDGDQKDGDQKDGNQNGGTPTTGGSTSGKTDKTKSKSSLPKTGLNGSILLVAGIISILIGVVSYIKYQDYKKIK